MDPFERAPFDRQVAGFGGAGAKNDGLEFVEELTRSQRLADVAIANELDAFLFEQLDPAQDDFLFIELHVGDAVHQQAAGAIRTFEDGYGVAGPVQLRRRRQARGARPHYGDFLPGPHLGRFGHDPAFFPAAIDDRALDVLDGDGRRVDPEHARTFTRRRAYAPGELGEIIGFVQAIEGFAPKTAVHEIVPFGDEIVDGTAGSHAAEERAGVTERNAAIHAARRLLPEARG